jgi:hypothetical protein
MAEEKDREIVCKIPYKQALAFDALIGERKYQEQFNSRKLSVGEELCLIQCYVNKAMQAYADTLNAPSEPATRDVIRKIGAMCLRAMENHGAVKRGELIMKEIMKVADEKRKELQ